MMAIIETRQGDPAGQKKELALNFQFIPGVTGIQGLSYDMNETRSELK